MPSTCISRICVLSGNLATNWCAEAKSAPATRHVMAACSGGHFSVGMDLGQARAADRSLGRQGPFAVTPLLLPLPWFLVVSPLIRGIHSVVPCCLWSDRGQYRAAGDVACTRAPFRPSRDTLLRKWAGDIRLLEQETMDCPGYAMVRRRSTRPARHRAASVSAGTHADVWRYGCAAPAVG